MGVFDGKQILNASVTSDKMAEDVFANMPIASSDEVLTNSSAGLKTNLSLVSDGSDMVLYGRDNIELGRVNIAIGNIQNAYYDSSKDEIVIVVVVQGGTDEIRIPADDLIDIYTGKEYIDVNSDNVISLNYELVKGQLIIDGFNTGINISDYYTSAQINSLLNKYLPLEGGTITGDLTVNGTFQSYAVNVQNINIDELKTEGNYYSPNPYNGGGTLPSNVSIGTYYTFNLSVKRIGSSTYQQFITGYTNSASRDVVQASRIITNSLVGDWFNHTAHSKQLSATDNIDELVTAGEYLLNSNIQINGTAPTNWSSSNSTLLLVYLTTSTGSVRQVMYNGTRIWTRTISSTIQNWSEIATVNDLKNYSNIYPITLEITALNNLNSSSTEEEIREVFGIDDDVSMYSFLKQLATDTMESKKALMFFDTTTSGTTDPAGGIMVDFTQVVSGLPYERRFFMRFNPYQNGLTQPTLINRTFIFRVYGRNESAPDPGALIEFIVLDNDLKEYLPLKGGDVTGTITTSSDLTLNNFDSVLRIYGSADNNATLGYESGIGAVFNSDFTYGMMLRATKNSGNITLNTAGGKAYYNQNEIATVNNIPTSVSQLTNDKSYITSSDLPDLSNYLPLTGGRMSGDIVLAANRLWLAQATGIASLSYTSDGVGTVLTGANQPGNSNVTIRANSDGNVQLTTSTGIATYNGSEIATVDDIAINRVTPSTDGVVPNTWYDSLNSIANQTGDLSLAGNNFTAAYSGKIDFEPSYFDVSSNKNISLAALENISIGSNGKLTFSSVTISLTSLGLDINAMKVYLGNKDTTEHIQIGNINSEVNIYGSSISLDADGNDTGIGITIGTKSDDTGSITIGNSSRPTTVVGNSFTYNGNEVATVDKTPYIIGNIKSIQTTSTSAEIEAVLPDFDGLLQAVSEGRAIIATTNYALPDQLYESIPVYVRITYYSQNSADIDFILHDHGPNLSFISASIKRIRRNAGNFYCEFSRTKNLFE